MAKLFKQQEDNNSSFSTLPAIILVFLLTLLAWYSHSAPSLNPPAVVPSSAPDTVFSAERARAHLYEITREPRPVGSPGHVRAKNYIISALEELGLEPEVQTATSNQQFQISIGVASVKNIIARIPGTNSTGAVVLAAHYDSAVHSLGATDAGNGVAAILETARALLSAPPLQNDVILLFTDAEEPSLYGARAFVNQHPWSEEASIVLNAEGSGHYGPVFLFRTSGQNGEMVRTFSKTVSKPFGTSLANNLFDFLPYFTDLTVFRGAGIPGMDFLSAHGFSHYHTMLDSYEQADPRTLQHHGNNLLPLTKAFGTQDLASIESPDRIFFTVPLLGFIHYPESFALPFAIFVVLFVLGLLVREYRKNRLILKGTLIGSLYFLAALLLLPLMAMGIWHLAASLIPETGWFVLNSPYNAGFYLFSICLILTAIFLLPAYRVWRKLSFGEILAAPLILWSVLTLLTAWWIPSASYMFVWPLFFSAAGLLLAGKPDDLSNKRIFILTLLAAPIIFISMQGIEGAKLMLTIAEIEVPALLLILALGLLSLQFYYIAQSLTWKLPLSLAVIGTVLLAWGVATADFDENRKKPNSINYIADVGEQEAWWYTLDPEPDEFTSRFLGLNPEQANLPDWAPQQPFGFTNTPWVSPAPLLRADAPDAEILSDTLVGEQRRVRLRITNPPGAYVTVIQFREASDIRLLQINDLDIYDGEMGDTYRSQPLINYFAPDEDGVEIEFTMPEGEVPELYLRSNIPGYPALEDGSRPKRPGHMMPVERWRDITQLQRTVML